MKNIQNNSEILYFFPILWKKVCIVKSTFFSFFFARIYE